MTLPIRVHAATHEGLVHEKNEDSYDVLTTDEGGLLLMVCDGMGGMGHGDEASAIAVKALGEFMETGAGFPPERLRQAIRRADVLVRDELCGGSRGLPGSTAVMVYIVDGVGHVAWVGDSRAYLIRGGTVMERTRDHKLVDELVAAGQLTEDEARSSSLAHVVTRALGGRSPKEKPVSGSTLGHPWKFAHDDAVVICSDGVCDLITDEELPGLLAGAEPEEATRNIVQLSLERGGHDNITVIVGIWDGADFSEEDAATPMFHSREKSPDDDVRDLGENVIPPSIDDTGDAPRVTEELAVDDIPPEPDDVQTPVGLGRGDDEVTQIDNDPPTPEPKGDADVSADEGPTPDKAQADPVAAAPKAPVEDESPAWMVPVAIIVFLMIAVGVGLSLM